MNSFLNLALSLKIKLPLSIVLIVAITMAGSTFFTLYHFSNVSETVRDKHLINTATVIGENIATQINQAGRDMVMAVSLPGVLQAVELKELDKKSTKNLNLRSNLTALFDRMLLAYGYYNAIYLVDEKGKYIVGTTPTVRDLTVGKYGIAFKKAFSSSSFTIGPTIYNPNINRLLVPIFLELVYNGHSGAIVSSLNIAKISNTALQEVPHEDVDTVVFSYDGKKLQGVSTNNIETILPKGAWVKELSEKPVGTINISQNGMNLGLAFYHIPQTDLFVATIANKGYMAEIHTFLSTSIVSANVIALLIIIFCVCFFTLPVASDILYLSRFAKSVTDGEDVDIIKSNRKDELGHLFASLAKMVSSLKEMIVRSEAATKAKSEFLARMSHEIRTPMNGILGMTFLALQANPDEKQKNYLKRIDTAAKTLLGVIDDILDFSKIEAEKMDINIISFRLSTVLSSMRDMLQPKCDEKRIGLIFSVAEDVPKIICSDPLRFTQIIINLCSNAIKFTSSGEVYVRIYVAKKDGDNITLAVSVKDTGIGMSKKEQARIFESFAQADGSTTRKFGGTGLGLAISKSLTQLLGGEIWVESEPGKGSTFNFTIQTKAGLESELEEENQSNSQAGFSLPSLNILLAEDNEINQEIALELLKSMGANVTLAQNGEEAVKLFKENDFDLILMDIQMPILDGLSATKRIRNGMHPQAKKIPIVAMTAHAMTGDKEKSLEAGMNDHITKPIDINELYNVLVMWGTASKVNSLSSKP